MERLVPRRVKLCCGRWNASLNALWLWWYCGAAVAMETYLLYRAVERCRQYNERPWNSPEKPVLELYVHIALIVIAIVSLPFFVVACLFQIGNYSNDGRRLGRDNVHEKELARVVGQRNSVASSTVSSNMSSASALQRGRLGGGGEAGITSKLQMFWRHSGPLCHGFHILAAFALMLPSSLLQAQEVKYGFAHPDEIWSSELDVLFGKNMLAEGALDFTNPDNASQSTPMPSPLPDVVLVTRQAMSASPEMINYVFALVVFGVRYSAVFWYSSMAFSFVFSLSQLLVILQFVFQYCGTGILYKFAVNLESVPGLELVLNPAAAMSLFLVADTVVYFSSIAVFNYGFLQYQESYRAFLRQYYPSLGKKAAVPTGCQGYVPHTIATLSLLLAVGCWSPMVYDLVVLYRKTGFPVILACIVMDAVYMVGWVAIWFVFTLKQSWDFKVALDLSEYARPSIYMIQNGHSLPADVTVLHDNSYQSSRDQGQGQVVPKGQGQGQPLQVKPKRPSQNRAHPVKQNPDAKLTISIPTDPPHPHSHSHSHSNLHLDGIELDDNGAAMHEPFDASHSPTGVLRKSGGRRNNPLQRVKFDDAVDHEGALGLELRDIDEEQQNPVKRRPRQEGSDGVRTPTPGENTLTRNYRHSLRDKCGEYYRASPIPPAAQSSPLMRDRPLSDSFPRADDYMLAPLKIHTHQEDDEDDEGGAYGNAKRPNNGATPKKPARQYSDQVRGLPPRKPLRTPSDHTRNAYADLPPLGPLSDDFPPKLRASKTRGSNRKSSESRHSYPPPIAPKPQVAPQPSNTPEDDQTQDGHRGSRNELTPSSKSQYIHKPSMSIDSAHGSSHSGSISHHDSSLLNSGYGNSYRNETPPPHTSLNSLQMKPTPYPNRNLNRDLRIVVKPELSHRDSALPSSNETSSNDSEENMLCSQV